MSFLHRAKDKLKSVIGSHGPEITTCVRIATQALIPGGGALIDTVGVLCDYANEKAKDVSEDEILAKLDSLGRDQDHLMTVIENLTTHFGPTLDQMSSMAQFNVPEEGLQNVQTRRQGDSAAEGLARDHHDFRRAQG